jgi:hypothetical protein
MKQINSVITTTPKEQRSQTGAQVGGHGLATLVSFPRLPSPTPALGKSLSPQDLQDHRAKIAFECRVFFVACNYWRGNEGAEVEAGVLAMWCDELQDWKQEQVVFALRQWNRDNPRLKATPGDIRSIMLRLRGEKEAARARSEPEPQEPPREKMSAERAAEIMAQVGFRPKGFSEGAAQ